MANDPMSDYLARQQTEKERARLRIQKACAVLERLGVQTITVEYDGIGDEGAINGILFEPEPSAGIPDGLVNVLEAAASNFLPTGFEIGEGSFGTLVVDVAERTFHCNQDWHVNEFADDQDEDNPDDQVIPS